MATVQNSEEAANLVSEFMTSLDNVPHEVQFLLQEIRFKDIRSQEINDEIVKDQARYIKHALAGGESPRSPAISASSRSISQLPAKISAAYASLDELSVEKIAIAEQLKALLHRTKLRLDIEAAKVRALNGIGDEPKLVPAASLKRSATTSAVPETYGQTRQITELRAALTADLGGTEPSNKRRRVTASSTPLRASPTLTGPLPVTIPSLPYTGGTTQRARSSTPRTSTTRAGSSRSRLRHSHTSGLLGEDLDADGDDDPDLDAEADPEEEEDLTLYCVCRKTSYGDMIGCDNNDCPYQWFHISCVGVETPLPDKWFCSECTLKGYAIPPPTAAEKKRGRK